MTRDSLGFGAVLGAAVALASLPRCLPNPDIDGADVAPITNPHPTCAEVCQRLVALCGYAPEGDPDGGIGNCTNDDASGYCDLQLTSELSCLATAPNCEVAWSTLDGGCAFVPVTEDAGQD